MQPDLCTPQDTFLSNLHLKPIEILDFNSVTFTFTSNLKFTLFVRVTMDTEIYFQFFLLNSIYYKGKVSTEEWGGVENMPLCFPKYLQSCGNY